MIKWLREILKDWNAVNKELSDMGIFTHPFGGYFSKEMFDLYLEKKKQEHTTNKK